MEIFTTLLNGFLAVGPYLLFVLMFILLLGAAGTQGEMQKEIKELTRTNDNFNRASRDLNREIGLLRDALSTQAQQAANRIAALQTAYSTNLAMISDVKSRMYTVLVGLNGGKSVQVNWDVEDEFEVEESDR